MFAIDVNNPVIKLCIQGTEAEFQGRIDEAREFYRQAWQASANDYEACIAAHYMARHRESIEEALHWNLKALEYANAVNDDSVRDFYPSLYLNLGRSYTLPGNQDRATKYFNLAASLGVLHDPEQLPYE
jgi:tetratricopeptide (TPR) repeat protein